MNFRSQKQQWKLKEFVQIGPEGHEEIGGLPLQLQEWRVPESQPTSTEPTPTNRVAQSAPKTEEGEEASINLKTPLWFLSGFYGAGKADAQIAALVARAVERGAFESKVDLFMTPICNPTASKSAKNWQGEDLTKVFGSETPTDLKSVEAKSLLRWIDYIKPRAIITFSIGESMIRHQNVPTDVIRKLGEISELETFAVGEEKQRSNEDGEVIAREDLANSFPAWCAQYRDVAWIDFCLDESRKKFEVLRDEEWRPSVGPALKWLSEGARFNPPPEEEKPQLPDVVPVVELPPEFANL